MNSTVYKFNTFKNSTIHDLDAFVLLKIFSFLGVREQLSCLQTCQKWRELLQNGSHRLRQLSVCFGNGYPVLELNSLNSQGKVLPSEVGHYTTATPSSLFTEHRLFARVQTLIVSSAFSNKILQLDFSQMPELKQLEIHGSSFEIRSDACLSSIQHLYLDEWCPSLIRIMPSLETLTLNELFSFDESTDHRWAQTICNPNLKRLKVNYVQICENEYTNRKVMSLLNSLAAYAPLLEQFNLMICFSGSYQTHRHYRSLIPLLMQMPNLKRLNLLFDLELDTVRNVCDYVRFLLHELRMHQSPIRVELQLRFIASLQQATAGVNDDLGKLLHFERCPNLESVCVNGHILQLPTSQLELLGYIGVQTLYITPAHLPLFDCSSSTAFLTEVRTLCVERDCPSTRSMVNLLSRLPKLKELYFDCHIEPQLLLKLPQLCPNLEYLALEHWPQTMDLRLLAALPLLRTIFLRTDSSSPVEIDHNALRELFIPAVLYTPSLRMPASPEPNDSLDEMNEQEPTASHPNWNLCQLIVASPQLCNVNVDSQLLDDCVDTFLDQLRFNAIHQPHLFHHLHVAYSFDTTAEQRKLLQLALQNAIDQAPDNLCVSFFG